MPGDADISDSIAKALPDVLQAKRTENNLLPAEIPLARIRAGQLKQCLLTERELSGNTVQAMLELISLEQETSGPTNLVKKVSTVSHVLQCTTNQPSTIICKPVAILQLYAPGSRSENFNTVLTS